MAEAAALRAPAVARPSRATASLAQLRNEFGIAVGITALGSLGTVAYRRLGESGAGHGNVVTDVADAAQLSDATLLASIRAAFTGAFHLVAMASLVVMVAVLVLLARPLTARTPQSQERLS